MANPEHLEILKQGVAAWNDWREANPEVEPDLRDADFLGVNLRGANLQNTDFTKAILTGASLSLANLTGASLTWANITWAELRDTNLKEAKLIETNFSEANLLRANLERANLEGAYLNGACLEGANLEGANLTRAFLEGANFEKANLAKADLTKADLTGANLWQASLIKTRLIDVTLKNATLWEADLSESVFLVSSTGSLDMENADLWGARLKKTYFLSPQALKPMHRPLSVEQEREAVYLDTTQQVVEEPFIELPQQALKARRSLLLTAVLCSLRGLPNVQWPEAVNLSGNVVEGLDANGINVILMGITAYFWTYFLISGLETYGQWKLRRTGLPEKELEKAHGGSGLLGESGRMVDQHTAYSDIASHLQTIREKLKNNTFDPADESERFIKLTKHLDPLLLHLTRTFWKHQKLVIRRFMFEFHLPLLFGVAALVWLGWSMLP